MSSTMLCLISTLLFRLEGSFKDLSTGDQFLSLSGKLLNAWNPMSFPWLTITECAVYLDMFSTVKNATDDWEVKFIRLTNCTAAMNFRGARVDAKASAEFDGLSGHYELMFNASMSGRIAAVIDGMIYGSALNESTTRDYGFLEDINITNSNLDVYFSTKKGWLRISGSASITKPQGELADVTRLALPRLSPTSVKYAFSVFCHLQLPKI